MEKNLCLHSYDNIKDLTQLWPVDLLGHWLSDAKSDKEIYIYIHIYISIGKCILHADSKKRKKEDQIFSDWTAKRKKVILWKVLVR